MYFYAKSQSYYLTSFDKNNGLVILLVQTLNSLLSKQVLLLIYIPNLKVFFLYIQTYFLDKIIITLNDEYLLEKIVENYLEYIIIQVSFLCEVSSIFIMIYVQLNCLARLQPFYLDILSAFSQLNYQNDMKVFVFAFYYFRNCVII